MIFSEQTPVQFKDALPARVDLVVIGGGIAGIATAWFARQRGLSVLVVEKGRVAGEQSSRNWGWVRQQGRDPAELPIMMESNRIWRGLAEQTGEAGLSFTQSGCLYLATNERELARYHEWHAVAKEHGLDTKLISASALRDHEIPVDGAFCGAMLTESDGRAEPWLAVPAWARAAGRAGVQLRENCAARTVDITDGQVTGVVTEHGAVRTDAVVLATGAWSNIFAHNTGFDLPQLCVRSTVARTPPNSSSRSQAFANVSAPGFAMRKRTDGGFTVTSADIAEHYLGPRSFRYLRQYLPLLRATARDVRLRLRKPSGYPGDFRLQAAWTADDESPFERERVLNPSPSPTVLRRIEKRLPKFAPWLDEPRIEEAWAGMIDVSPDAVPYLGPAPEPSGLFLATGLSGHGFGIGPAVGKIMADLVLGNTIDHELTRFRYDRFFDGSKIVPGPY